MLATSFKFPRRLLATSFEAAFNRIQNWLDILLNQRLLVYRKLIHFGETATRELPAPKALLPQNPSSIDLAES
jgi:hypothetical protein